MRWAVLLRNGHPPPGGDDVHVYDVYVLLADGSQQAADYRRAEGCQIVLGDLAGVVYFDPFHLALAELDGQRSSLRRHWDVRRQVRVGLGGDEGRVDGVLRWIPVQHGDDLLRHVQGDALLRLRRGRAQVRRDHHLLIPEQGVAGQRLRLEYVQGDTGQSSIRKRR